MNYFNLKHLNFSILTVLISGILFSLTSAVFASDQKWPLRHKGEVRYMKMIKVYDVSLYSPTSVNAANVLNPDVSKCLKLDYAVNLSVDKFRLATSKILQRQHDSTYLASIKQPLERLQSAYKPVKKGDIYKLCYNGKNKTIRLDLNNKTLTEIQSAELAKAYMGIWLSNNKPISNSLYQAFFSNKQ